MNTLRTLVAASAAAVALLAAAPAAEARPGPAGYHGGYHGGGYYHGGYYRGGYWGPRYWGPGPYWGAVGLGLGVGALVYGSSYYGGYYGVYDDPYYGSAPVVVSPRAAYVAVDPPLEGNVVRSGQPVPAASRAAEPIFYPKNGQSAAAIENDRRECNRWATTQQGAMNDASIFQRATFACMEGRGYSVR